MKKLLLGTTALVAAGLVAGEASAASALKLGITGFYRNAIGGSFGNGPTTQLPTAGGGVSTAGLGNFDRQNVSMRQEIRVNFTGQTTLDNGITVGVLVGLNGETSPSPAAPPRSTALMPISAASSVWSASVRRTRPWSPTASSIQAT